MLIKYTGEKSKKTLQLNHKTYEFIPTCEVVDKEALKFLLSDERMGLFEEVKESGISPHNLLHPVNPVDNPVPQAKPDQKQKGRPRKA